MEIMYFNRRGDIVRCFNGELYERPFANDLVRFDNESYKVVNVTINYDDEKFMVFIEPI